MQSSETHSTKASPQTRLRFPWFSPSSLIPFAFSIGIAALEPVRANDPNLVIEAPYLYYDFEDGVGNTLTDRSGNEFTGRVTGNVVLTQGAPGGSTPRRGARFSVGLPGVVDVPGLDVPTQLAHRNRNPNGSYTLSCWLRPNVQSVGGDHFFFGQITEGLHAGLRGAGMLHTAHWASDFSGRSTLSAKEWVHAAWTYDGPTDTARIFLNGSLDGGPFSQLGPNGSGHLILGGDDGGPFRNPFMRHYVGDVDEIAIWRVVLSDESIRALASGASPNTANCADDDSDGMEDGWEQAHMVDDPNADPDGDGLVNIDEFRNRTDPNDADTDQDELDDQSELIDGTNPLRTDSDYDDLSDSQESLLGTDPNDPDSDDDGFSDGVEAATGADPLSPTSLPGAESPYLYYDFEGDRGTTLNDKSGNGFAGTIQNSISFTEGAPLGSTPARGGRFSVGGPGFVVVSEFDVSELGNRTVNPDGSYTLSCWLKPDAQSIGGDHFLFGQSEEGLHTGLRNRGTLHTAHWGSDFSANTVLEPDQWVHTVWTYNGLRDQAVVYLNGVRDGGPFTQLAPNGSGNLILGGRDGGVDNFVGDVDEIAVWRYVIPEDFIVALAEGASPIPPPRYEFDFDVHTDGDGLVFTWQSTIGQTFNLRSALDPSQGDPSEWPIAEGAEGIGATPPRNSLRLPLPPENTRLFVLEEVHALLP